MPNYHRSRPGEEKDAERFPPKIGPNFRKDNNFLNLLRGGGNVFAFPHGNRNNTILGCGYELIGFEEHYST